MNAAILNMGGRVLPAWPKVTDGEFTTMTKTAVGAADDDEGKRLAAALASAQPGLQQILRQLAQVSRAAYQPVLSQNLAAAIAATQTPAVQQIAAQLAQVSRTAYRPVLSQNLAAAIAATQTPAVQQIAAQLAQVSRAAYRPVLSQNLAAAIAATQTPAVQQIAAQLAQVQRTLRWSPGVRDLTIRVAALQAPSVSAFLANTVDGKRTVEDELEATAHLFKGTDVLADLGNSSAELLDDPIGWLEESERGAISGASEGALAGDAARYLLGCFVLLAQRLNPSAETIERYASAISMFVLLVLTMGMLNTADPKLLDNLNAVLGTPAGIVGIYLALRPREPVRKSPRKHKKSATVRRNSRSLSRKMRSRSVRR